MKFTFEIVETSSVRHTVVAESLMEAESKMNETYWAGKVDIEKYGAHEYNINLVKIAND